VRDLAIVTMPPATGNRKIALAAIVFVTCCRSRRTGARANTKMKPRFQTTRLKGVGYEHSQCPLWVIKRTFCSANQPVSASYPPPIATRKCRHQSRVMSALLPRADIRRTNCQVRFVPSSDITRLELNIKVAAN
jgi:hypothetical protein